MRIRPALLAILAIALSSTDIVAAPQTTTENDRLGAILTGERPATVAAPEEVPVSLPAKRGRTAHRTAVGESEPAPAFQPYQHPDKNQPNRRGKVVPGLMLVKFKPDNKGGADAMARLAATPGVGRTKRSFPLATADRPIKGRGQQKPRPAGGKPLPDLTRWHRVELANNKADIHAAVAELKRMDGVEWAEPVYERRSNGTTTESDPAAQSLPTAGTDPLYASQWHLDGANVPAAWAYLEGQGKPAGGSSDVTVAVIDTGVDYTHSDLADNMWVNVAEIADNGIDDDGNGFVDDIHGVNVIANTGEPQDDNGHGTHVAGIIAATGENGIGGTGVAYGVKIMAIKAAQYSGILTSADIAEGIYYAAAQGADVINMSFGGYGRSFVEEDALAVAFGTSVLVAAAGNDGIANQPCPIIGAPMYPASYPWVLGVMAGTSNGSKAGFSNWDCIPKNGLEYELMAPGRQIWSTLPNEGYSGWSGTSMAAPVASGIAALLRTNWSDKSVYSSRFIMGQLAGTTVAGSVDANEALTNTPKPALAYLEHWVWDTTNQGAGNDDDGIVDAGETIDLAIVVKNHWGRGDPVSVTLEAWADGAIGPDTYVTMITDTVDYGAVGSFNQDDNGLIYDADGVVTGVTSPFQFSVASNTPNDHLIPFRLTMTAGNGLDPNDAQSYTTTSYFYLVVQRGRQLPSVIDSDAIGTEGGNVDTDGIEDGIVTLDDSSLWIIDKPVLVYPGIELKMTEGAQVQFWSTQPDDAYAVFQNSYLQVEGTFTVQGTTERPVVMGPSQLFPYRMVVIKTKSTATSNLEFVEITNPRLVNPDDWSFAGPMAGMNAISHALFSRNPGRFGIYLEWEKNSGNWSEAMLPSIYAKHISNSRFRKLAHEYIFESENQKNYRRFPPGILSPLSLTGSLFDNTWLNSGDWRVGATVDDVQGNVFLKGYQKWTNSSGQTIFGSSRLEGGPIGKILGAQVFEPAEYGGATYAVFHPYSGAGTFEDKMHMAQSFAESLGGHLVVFSDQAEMDFVNTWSYNQGQQPLEYWSGTYSFCDTGNPNDTYCADIFNDNHAAIGLVRETDGSYVWINGETPAIGFPEDQYYWTDTNFLPREAAFAGIRLFGPNLSLGQYYLAPLSKDYEAVYGNRIILELPGTLSLQDLETALATFIGDYVPQGGFTNNAILNVWHDLNADHWLTIKAPDGDPTRRWSTEVRIPNNYWGGASDTLISTAITDYFDDFNLTPMSFHPILETAPETAYPFVADVVFTDINGNELQGDRFGAETINWTVTFNRDMDTSIQPNVWFGPAEPFTDFGVTGDWADARTWQGSFNITPVTGDGWQYAYVRGAVAADDPWLVTGHDSERFRFEIITSGTEALTLQATGGVGGVNLSWIQDDFDLLHGYNIYRSLDPDNGFTRINNVVIPNGTNTFSDTDVAPGVNHYYRFTVVSDRGESDFSNTALGTPLDSIPPVITHTPILETTAGANRTITATITDNIAVQSATLFYRAVGSVDYVARSMVATPVDQYSATLEGSLLQPPGVDYYLSASDGVNTVTNGTAASPHRLAVGDTDRDGMPDDWEATFGLNPNDAADAAADQDGDSLSNLDEFRVGTDPTKADSDGDAVNDNIDAFPMNQAEWDDTDGDGIGNNADLDDDNDGMTDEFETANNLDPLDPTDADADADGDGFTNLREFTAGSDPQDASDFPKTRRVPVAIQILLGDD